MLYIVTPINKMLSSLNKYLTKYLDKYVHADKNKKVGDHIVCGLKGLKLKGNDDADYIKATAVLEILYRTL